MKQTPQEKKTEERLAAGILSAEGFLGNETRSYAEIIASDLQTVEALGYAKEDLAQRMQYFADKAFEHFEGALIVDEKFEVEYLSYRGFLVCPFSHPGRFRKGTVSVLNKTNGIKVIFTPLNIHLIAEHGFFEGKGAKHRLEPEILVKALYL